MTIVSSEFRTLAESLSPLGITQSTMFGMPVLKLGRRPICGLDDDGVMFKLPVNSSEMKRALALENSRLFSPSMGGRTVTMKQWVVVSANHKQHYYEFALRSILFLEQDS